MLQHQRTSLPRSIIYRIIDLIAVIAALAIGIPFLLVVAAPFL